MGKVISSIGLGAGMLIALAACSQQKFSSLPAQKVDSAVSTDPAAFTIDAGPDDSSLQVVTQQPTPAAGSACDSHMGESCEASRRVMAAGCGHPEYHCVDFWAVYYNSPKGCDSSAQSFIEYSFDGTGLYYTGRNTAGVYKVKEYSGDFSSHLRCTYIGKAYFDAFHNIPNGTCFNSTASGYAIPNTYTKVIPGTGCMHQKLESVPGTIQCDGSCQ